MQNKLKIATFFAFIFVLFVFFIKYFYTTERTFMSPHLITDEEIQKIYEKNDSSDNMKDTDDQNNLSNLSPAIIEDFNYNAPINEVDIKALKRNTNKKLSYGNYEDSVRMSSPTKLDSNGLYVALVQAVGDNDLERAKTLIKKGAKVNSPDGDTFYAPIFWAISNGNVEIIKLLLDSGVKINTPDEKGMFPIHYVIENSSNRPYSYRMKSIFDLMLAANPGEINRQDNVLKQTPIMKAVNLNNKKAFAYLLDKGANLNIIDKNNKDIINLCLENSCSTCITLIDNKKTINEKTPLSNFSSTFTAPDPIWLPYSQKPKTTKKKNTKKKDPNSIVIEGDSYTIPTYKEMPNILPLEKEQGPDIVITH